MFVEHRKFKCVVEEIVVVLDVQVLVVNFVSGETAQFVEDVACGTGDMEIATDGFPAANLARFHIKIRTAVEHH